MQAKKVADVLGVTVPDKITSGDLKGTPTTPTVTPTSVDTTTPGVLGAVESSMDQFTKMAQENKKNAQQASDTSRTAYTDRLKTTPTESELTATQYETQGVNTAQKELDDINSQLQVEQNALRREMERIQDNKTGASMGQVQNMVNEAESKSLRKQADLAVIQMGLQGKFNTAKAIADRAVDASMEREKNTLEALKINYEDNKALFTTAEQREFDTLLSDRERKYNEELAGKKAISDYSIEAMKMGAGSDIINAIRGAKTPEEAQAIAAGYMSPIIQREQQTDMQLKQAQLQKAMQDLNGGTGLNWGDRAKILALAEKGDPMAIAMLGYDPATSDPKTIAANESVKLETADALSRIDKLIGNSFGIKSSSGSFQSPMLAKIASGAAIGTGVGAAAGSAVPVVGTIAGAGAGLLGGIAEGVMSGMASKREKENFLGSIEYLLSGKTFEKFVELKKNGVTFGATTEREWGAVQKAASELEAISKRDKEGKLTGFKGSEENLVRVLNEYRKNTARFMDELNAKQFSTSDIYQVENL